MSLISKAHVIYLNSKGINSVIESLNYLGSVADDTERDALTGLNFGDVIVVSNSADANNTPAIYHWNGSDFDQIGSEYIVNAVTAILNNRYSATQIDSKLQLLGIYPPVNNLADLTAIPTPQEGYICVVKNDSGKMVTYQYRSATWSKLIDQDTLANLTSVVSSIATLTNLTNESKYWKSPKNTILELTSLPTALVGEIRLVHTGINGNPTLYRYDTSWNPIDTIPMVPLISNLTSYVPVGLTNRLVFVLQTGNIHYYSQGDSEWKQLTVAPGFVLQASDISGRTAVTPTNSMEFLVNDAAVLKKFDVEALGDFYTIPTIKTDITDLQTEVSNMVPAYVNKGTWDASTGVFPNATAKNGWTYICSVSGTVDGIDFVADQDKVTALKNNPGDTTYATNWWKTDGSDKVFSVNSQVGAVEVQETLVSEINIKSIRGTTLLGTGAITNVPKTVTFATAPTITDDSAAGFLNGDEWTDSVTGDRYKLKDNTIGAALWEEINSKSFTYEISFNEVLDVLQRFTVATNITAITAYNVATLKYSINDAADVTVTLPFAGTIALSSGDRIVWKITYTTGTLAVLNLTATEV